MPGKQAALSSYTIEDSAFCSTGSRAAGSSLGVRPDSREDGCRACAHRSCGGFTVKRTNTQMLCKNILETIKDNLKLIGYLMILVQHIIM